MLDSEFVLPGSANEKDIAFPRFFPKAKKLNFRSEQEGKPVFETRDYVEITTPGDTRSIMCREVTDADKARWPREWAAYKENRELSPVGTPLEQWPLIDLDMIEHLKHFRIRSVETLSEIGDNAIQNIGMGARALRDKAKAWLAQAVDGSAISKLIAERDGQARQIDDLKRQMADLAASVRTNNEAVDAAQGVAPSAKMSAEALQRMIAESTAAAVAAALANAPAAPKAEPVKRTRRTKAEMEAARAEEGEAQ